MTQRALLHVAKGVLGKALEPSDTVILCPATLGDVDGTVIVFSTGDGFALAPLLGTGLGTIVQLKEAPVAVVSTSSLRQAALAVVYEKFVEFYNYEDVLVLQETLALPEDCVALSAAASSTRLVIGCDDGSVLLYSKLLKLLSRKAVKEVEHPLDLAGITGLEAGTAITARTSACEVVEFDEDYRCVWRLPGTVQCHARFGEYLYAVGVAHGAGFSYARRDGHSSTLGPCSVPICTCRADFERFQRSEEIPHSVGILVGDASGHVSLISGHLKVMDIDLNALFGASCYALQVLWAPYGGEADAITIVTTLGSVGVWVVSRQHEFNPIASSPPVTLTLTATATLDASAREREKDPDARQAVHAARSVRVLELSNALRMAQPPPPPTTPAVSIAPLLSISTDLLGYGTRQVLVWCVNSAEPVSDISVAVLADERWAVARGGVYELAVVGERPVERRVHLQAPDGDATGGGSVTIVIYQGESVVKSVDVEMPVVCTL